MPRIIEYNVVQQRMSEAGFVSLYHNSGAFGFAPDAKVTTCGWIGPDDATIRGDAREWVRQVPPPFEENLAAAMAKVRSTLPGDAWLMPQSHWHYELHFGNGELLEEVLKSIGVDPAMLRDRNNGSAIAFSVEEDAAIHQTVERLLTGLVGSDFLLAFPESMTLCTIHHHKQLWWQTTDAAIAAALDSPSI